MCGPEAQLEDPGQVALQEPHAGQSVTPSSLSCYLRLLNYITSDYVGINYFNKEPYLISNLIKVFKEERDDTSVKKHSLGVLQKLSLLRQPQEIMLREGILEEIIHLLHQPDLSDYNVQYLTALLMNLSLRKLGKPKLEEHTTCKPWTM